MNWEDIFLAVVGVIGLTIVPFALHNIILATMMSMRGEQYQAHATGMWRLARAMIIMSIDQEIIATTPIRFSTLDQAPSLGVRHADEDGDQALSQAVSRKDDDNYFHRVISNDGDNDDAWLVDLTLKYKVGSASYMEYMGIPTQVNEYLCA